MTALYMLAQLARVAALTATLPWRALLVRNIGSCGGADTLWFLPRALGVASVATLGAGGNTEEVLEDPFESCESRRILSLLWLVKSGREGLGMWFARGSALLVRPGVDGPPG